MPRGHKHKRAQDEARLAEEKARGEGPQAKRKGGRPRKYAGETPRERDAEAARIRRAARKAEREAEKALRAQAGVERLDAAATIREEVEGKGPPVTEPELADPGPLTVDGAPVSPLWAMVRHRYSKHTVSLVDCLVRRQRLELDDLVWLEFAEHAEMEPRRHEKGVDGVMLQSRKQLARLLVARGPIGGVNDVPVRVPEGLELEALTRPLTDGDDVLAQPPDVAFPARYR